MPPVATINNIFMQLRKVCQHPYLYDDDLEDLNQSAEEQQKRLVATSGKFAFLKLLLPKLKAKGHRILMFSQFKIVLNIIEEFLEGEGFKFLRLDGDVQQAQRQRDIDAFNAPDSDYFIFLLTTRAGGVGINLATADTVIVFDPDWNPHQDLQAIARSHRYGQKKKVMVFKLMMRESVEERMIQLGKKKLVLDHLVVQNLGKETEEGDVESMILYGAKALYDENSDKNDIVYTSEDVDEIIENVEKQAEEEAKVMAEREKDKVSNDNNAETSTEAGAVARQKETMSFGFAKIWETAKKTQLEMNDADEAAVDDDLEDNLALIHENALKEAQRQMEDDAADGARRKRARKEAVNYRVDGAAQDDTPKKKKLKGKGKAEVADVSDADSVFNPEATPSEDSLDMDELVREGVGNLLDNNTRARTQVNGSGKKRIGKQAMRDLEANTIAQLRVAEAAYHAFMAQNQSGNSNAVVPDQSQISMPSQSSHKKYPGETPEQRAARKAARREEKQRLKAAQTEGMDLREGVVQSQRSFVQAQRIRQGQLVLQWLYKVLDEFKLATERHAWARMALPEISVVERREIYGRLSRLADDSLAEVHQPPYFTRADHTRSVFTVFDASESVFPVSNADRLTAPPIPTFPQPADEPKDKHGFANPRRRSPVKGSVPPPMPNGHSIPLQGPSTQAINGIFQGIPGPSQRGVPSSTMSAVSKNNPVHDFQSGVSINSKRIASPAAAPPAMQDSVSSAKPPAPILSTNDLKKLSLQDLYSMRDRVNKWAQSSSKDTILEKIGSLILVKARESATGPTFQWPLEASANHGNEGHSRNAESHRRGQNDSMSSQEHVIAPTISQDPPQMESFPAPSHSSQSTRHRGNFKGCVICGATRHHTAVQCPVVRAGPDSIRAALHRFGPDDALHSALQILLQQAMEKRAKQCAFCDRDCGQDVRSCAESDGGRRQLKNLIRKISAEDEASGSPTSDRLNKLYAAYEAWPKEAK